MPFLIGECAVQLREHVSFHTDADPSPDTKVPLLWKYQP